MGKVPKRVILTRSQEDIEKDRVHFERLGFEVVALPLIHSVPLEFGPVNGSYDWIVFQSVRAVKYFLRGSPLPPEAEVVAVGERTKQFLEQMGIEVALVPKDSCAEGIVESMRDQKRGRVLIPRSAKGRMTAIEGLRDLGFEVDEVAVYDLVTVIHDEEVIKEKLGKGGFIVFASPSAVKGLFANLQRDVVITYLERLVVVAIGKTTKRELEGHGISRVYIPSKPMMEAVAGKIHSLWHENCTN